MRNPWDWSTVLSLIVGIASVAFAAHEGLPWITAMLGISVGMNLGAFLLRWGHWRRTEAWLKARNRRDAKDGGVSWE